MRSFLRNLCDRVGSGQPEVIALRFADHASLRNRAGDPPLTAVFSTAAAEARRRNAGCVGLFRALVDRQRAARDHAG